MSVSDMNMSWSTLSARQSVKSQDSSVFITSCRKAGSAVQRSIIRPKCVSAKNGGMRFQSWREPKPLRSRCGSAVYISHDNDSEKVTPPNRKSLKQPIKRSLPSEENNSTCGVNEIVSRLSQPTFSSNHKTTRRPREANVDMNWYSWSKMNVYKDYQAVIYKGNGTLRPKSLGKAR